MRLKQRDIEAIKAAAAQAFGNTATVRLYGSRTRHDLRGGDIDLLIEADPNGEPELRRIVTFKNALFRYIDEQKVDVVLMERGRPLSAFARLIAPTSLPIV